MWNTLLMILLLLAAIVLILLVLIQRGKGGGLAGALGGMGGQSAFGTKAGDTFTRITIAVATIWILLCVVSVKALRDPESKIDVGDTGNVPGAATGTEPGGEDAE